MPMTERSIVAAALFASEDGIVNMLRDYGDDALVEAGSTFWSQTVYPVSVAVYCRRPMLRSSWR